MMVRSAAKSVSNTLSKPTACRAAAKRPGVASSRESPTPSPQAARTAGATCTTVSTVGSRMASMMRLTSSRAVRAPVGQWVMHWPHSAQPASAMGRLSRTITFIEGPAPVKSHTPQCCTLSQMATQRMHLMHLLLSRCSGKVASHGSGTGRASPASCRLKVLERKRRAQVSWRTQVAQSARWSSMMACRFARRAAATCGVPVRTAIPSRTAVLQEATSPSPSTSTRHTRHEPMQFRSFR